MMNYLKIAVIFTVVALGLARAEPDFTVSGTTYNSGAVVNEWAQYTLQTGGTVTVKGGANIGFSAGSRITLYPGFSVEPGGTFNATTSAIPSYNPGGYYNGFTPTLAPLSGDQQYGTIGQFNLQPFDVLVWNAAGTAPLVNAPVLLTVNIGGGWLSATNGANPILAKTLRLMTDGDGTVHAYYQQGSAVEVTSYIQVVAGTQILQFTTYSTLDIAIPTVPAGLAASNISTSGFTLSWNTSHDDIAVTGYDVFKDGLFVGSSVTTSYVVTGLVPETTYSMTVKAKDADAHVSAASAPLAVTTPDVTAPSVPANLAASNLTTTGVTLTWTASTDNIAVTGYDIYQNNVLIGSSATPGYTVTGLTPVMGYSFTVKAKDAANNVSAASSAVSVTTLTPVTPIAEVAGSFRTGKTSAAAPTGTNRMLVFVAQSETSGTLNSVTYGGRSLIRAVALTNSTNETSIWYLDDAGITSAANTTFVTSWSGSESGEGYSNFFLTGVDQANPVKAVRSAADPYTTANVSISTSSITVANGDYSVFAPVRGGAAGAFTFGGGFTERLHYAITSGDAALATRASTTGETITPAVAHATAAERMTLTVCVFQPAPYEIAPVVAVTEVAGSFTTGKTSASVPTGTNRLLVFVAQGENSGTLNSVTYGGQNMTLAVKKVEAVNEVSIWYLNDAGIAAATGTGFVTSWSGPESVEGYSSFFLRNVGQITPVGLTSSFSSVYTTVNVHVSIAGIAVGPGDYVAFAVVQGMDPAVFTFAGGFTERLHYAIESGDAALATRAITVDTAVTPSVAHSLLGNRIALAACVFKPAPSAPANLVASAVTTTGFTLAWNAAFDNTAVTGYDVYKNGVFVGATNTLSYGVTGLSAGTAYTMTVKARDADGNASAASAPLVVTTSTDGQAPSVPAGLATANLGATGFTLTWSASTDNIGVTGYDIFKDGVLLGTSATPSYAVTGLVPLTSYGMTVKARDAVGNVSAASATLSVTTTADTTAPVAPAGLSAASLATTGFTLNWSAATDNIGVTGYDIFKDGVQIGSSATLSYSVSGLAPLTSYSMTVKAKDAAGNLSAASTALSVTTTADVAAPSAPAGLVASALSTTTFTLGWNAATDNVAVTGYDVYKNGTLVGSSATLSYAVTGLAPSTAYNMTVKAKDAAGNSSAASATLVVTTSTDSEAPTAPSGLAESNLATTSFTLSWSAATDNIGVTGYDIFKDGVQVGNSATLNYVVTGLAPLTSYNMTVKARDAAGNVSAASAPRSVTTAADTAAPTAPGGLSSSGIATTGFTLNWGASTDNVAVTGYDIFKDGVQIGSSATLTYAVSNLAPLTAYSMTVKARDAAGNASITSTALSVTTLADTAAPAAPTGLTASALGTTTFTLSWSAATDNVAVTSYEIFQNGVPVGSSTTLSQSVTGLAPGTAYNMTVKAKDAAGNSSAVSATLVVTTSTDSEAPTAPSGLDATNLATTSFTLSWSAATDNIGVTGYTIFKDGVQIGTSATLSYTVTGLAPLTSYGMTVKARDAANNVSVASAPLTVTTTTDTAAPAAPAGLSASGVATTSFTLNWLASTDNVAVTSYDIFQDGVQIGSSATLTYAVSNLTPLTAYGMTVKAKDAAGNASAASTTFFVTTLADTAAPVAPTGLSSGVVATTSFTLNWVVSTDNVAVAGYDIFKDGVQIGSSATLTYAVSNLAPLTAYVMTVKARDAAGNISTSSQALSVTTLADTAAPDAPIGLVSSNLALTSFTLSWSATADNVAVTGYDVFKGGVLIGSTAAPTFAVTNLTTGTAYAMTVKAKDAANNVSLASTVLNVTTLVDGEAPSVPTTLEVSDLGVTGFTLSWAPSTDNVGVTGYVVYRNGGEPGILVTGTSLEVGELTPGTLYGMTVKARDAAGNVSAASTVKQVTTLLPPDETAPSSPENLQSSNVEMTSFTLSWDPSTDNVGVAGYVVYKDGEEPGTVVTGPIIEISGLTPGTLYSLTVSALDAAGNESAESEAYPVTTAPDTEVPTVPTALSGSDVTEDSFILKWAASTDNVGVAGYDIYKDGVFLVSSASRIYNISGLSPVTSYSITIKSKDAAGNESLASDPLVVTTLASVPTEIHAPEDLVVTFNAATGAMDIQWSDVSAYENGYRVERRLAGLPEVWELLAQLPPNTTSYHDQGVAEKTTYIYRVLATNSVGGSASAVSGDVVTPPVVPLAPGVVGWVSISGGASVRLDWVDNSSNETGFKIQRQIGAGAWQDLAQAGANVTSYVDSGLTLSQAYQYRVAAVNVTALSAWTSVYQVWAVPSAPSNLQSLAIDTDSVRIGWVSGVGSGTLSEQIRRYRATVLEAAIAVNVGSGSYLDAGLQSATTYGYGVITRNERGSSVETVITLTTVAALPTLPVSLSAAATSPTSVSLTWTWPTGGLRVDQIAVERSADAGVSWSAVASGLASGVLGFVDNLGLEPATTYQYRLKISWQQMSTYSMIASATTTAARAGNMPPESLAAVPLVSTVAYLANTVNGQALEAADHVASIGEYWFVGSDTNADSETVNPDGVKVYKAVNGVLQDQGFVIRPTSDSADYTQWFGWSVRTKGDRIYVAAPMARRTAGNTGTPQCGVVYEFQWTLNVNGTFTVTEKQRVAPADGATNDYFGFAFSVGENRLIVGAPNRDTGGTDSGRAYFYERPSTSASWGQAGSFDGSQSAENMGRSVALNGRHFVLGAPGHDSVVSGTSISNSGAIVLGRWGEGLFITLNNPLFNFPSVPPGNAAQSAFGYSVALDAGLRVLVGMPGQSAYSQGGAVSWLNWDGRMLDASFTTTIFTASGLSAGSMFGARVVGFQGESLITSATQTYQFVQVINALLETDTALLGSFDPEEDPTAISILNDQWNAFELVSRSQRSYLKMKADASLQINVAKAITLRSRDDQGAVLDRNIWVKGELVNPTNDSDGDGMDNAWELANGLNPNYAGDANFDSDGDGLTSLAEYRRYVANSSGGGKNPNLWDLDPDGDLDGDGVLNKFDARPNDPSKGALSVNIIEPQSGAQY